jgi:hypothetical protein
MGKRMKPVLYTYDPDSDEENPKVRPAWSKTKSELQKAALLACHRVYFKSREERKRWNLLEEKTRGATDEEIMFAAWIKHNTTLCANANSLQLVRTFDTLLAMIGNEERRKDWVAKNRKEVFLNNKVSVENIFKQ